MEVRHGHFSSLFHARPTTNASIAVGPKNASSTAIAPRVPPAHCPMDTIIIMLGPGAICPTLYIWISCGKVIHLWTSTVSIFISGKAAMPPPTVRIDRYENTRIRAGIWFMTSDPLFALCEDDGRESREFQLRSAIAGPPSANGSLQSPSSP